MKRIFGIAVILLSLIASVAQAKVVRTELFEALKGILSKETSPIMREAQEILDATRAGMEHAVPGAHGLNDQGFIILEANEKTGSAVVVKPVKKGTEVFGYKDRWNRDNVYESSGELEIGISSPVSVEQQKYISYYVRQEGEDILNATKERPGFSRIFAGYLKEDSELEVASKNIAIRYSQSPETVISSYSRVVKGEDGNFVVVRSIRINADKMDPAEFDDIVSAAKDLIQKRI